MKNTNIYSEEFESNNVPIRNVVLDESNAEHADDLEVNDNNSDYINYENVLKSDIGSSIFHADNVSGDTLSFYNLGVVYVDYVEMKRMFERIREINIEMTAEFSNLIGALTELASLVDYSLNIDDMNMSSIGLESEFDFNEEDDFSSLSELDAACSTYILGLSDNISNVLKIMNDQIVLYQEQTKMTDENIRDLNAMVSQVMQNYNLNYTNYDGENVNITYNELLGKYKEREKELFQIDGINLYNVDGSVNQNAIESLDALLRDQVINRSGRFMTDKDGNTLGYLQCTWWANARASQYLGKNYPTLNGNGGDYFKNNKWFESGTEPRPNSLVVYRFGDCGHVAYVEAVDEINGKIYISDADSGSAFRGIEELDYNGKWCGYSPQGYIYLDSPIDNGK